MDKKEETWIPKIFHHYVFVYDVIFTLTSWRWMIPTCQACRHFHTNQVGNFNYVKFGSTRKNAHRANVCWSAAYDVPEFDSNIFPVWKAHCEKSLERFTGETNESELKYLLGQAKVLQASSSLSDPGHPDPSGSAFKHVLLLNLNPPPHDRVHSPMEIQEDQNEQIYFVKWIHFLKLAITKYEKTFCLYIIIHLTVL